MPEEFSSPGMLRVAYNPPRLETTGINYGAENPVETKSYEVYQYLLHQPNQFATVHFTAESGAGYYTILAQNQGLICSKSKFVVSIGNLAPGNLEQLEKGDHVISDVTTLKKDYIVKKTVELAVCVLTKG
jgi:hypothetical protein